MTSYAKRRRELDAMEERRLAALAPAGPARARCAICGRPADLGEMLLVTRRGNPHEGYTVHRPSTGWTCFGTVGAASEWAITPATDSDRVS